MPPDNKLSGMAERPEQADDSGVAEALRAAIERTLAATAPAAGRTRERAGELVDEVVRRGQDAREEIARRGQEAGAEIAKRGQELTRRGQEAQAELARQLEALERRMASLEEQLRRSDVSEGSEAPDSKPKAEE
jgi:polyhydroxyalkanoate synthesis regulator phasin